MKKVTTLFLMLCLTLSGALCYASGLAGTENEKGEDGTPLVIIKNSSHTSSEKGNSIIATLNSHILMVVFTENLGEVVVEVSTATGGYVQTDSSLTPNGLQFYIPLAGDYIVNFTLPNGDVYYGEFTVTD
ncbi:MAG: DUF3244 domain-containing protein [Bacteroidales bacterium]|nr:DUF3244 domain-containing protein [Bacteroidales bacterium]